LITGERRKNRTESKEEGKRENGDCGKQIVVGTTGEARPGGNKREERRKPKRPKDKGGQKSDKRQERKEIQREKKNTKGLGRKGRVGESKVILNSAENFGIND